MHQNQNSEKKNFKKVFSQNYLLKIPEFSE